LREYKNQRYFKHFSRTKEMRGTAPRADQAIQKYASRTLNCERGFGEEGGRLPNGCNPKNKHPREKPLAKGNPKESKSIASGPPASRKKAPTKGDEFATNKGPLHETSNGKKFPWSSKRHSKKTLAPSKKTAEKRSQERKKSFRRDPWQQKNSPL